MALLVLKKDWEVTEDNFDSWIDEFYLNPIDPSIKTPKIDFYKERAREIGLAETLNEMTGEYPSLFTIDYSSENEDRGGAFFVKKY